ncbi:MAG: hypothetical protein FJW40_05930 [Acidobacteria bacterium]|nr:hypothetical protein [Acidobacteriota bacterium]
MKRLIFWDFKRASWQYDVVVGLILAFIFLTPRAWFADQPRASSVVMLPAEHGAPVYWLDPDQLDGVPGEQRAGVAARLVSQKAKRDVQVVRIEPISNSEKEIRGYLAYIK